MVKIEVLIQEGKVSRIKELELERYVHFFETSSKDNLEHCEFVRDQFPRWSIISGYYAMHDMTKLLLAKKFRLKIEYEVHATTIKVLAELIKNKELLQLIKDGYKEFMSLANDLAEGKKERTKAQYYTGTRFMKEHYRERAREFIAATAKPYLQKMERLL